MVSLVSSFVSVTSDDHKQHVHDSYEKGTTSSSDVTDTNVDTEDTDKDESNHSILACARRSEERHVLGPNNASCVFQSTGGSSGGADGAGLHTTGYIHRIH